MLQDTLLSLMSMTRILKISGTKRSVEGFILMH